jgi:hypothetical protein
VEEYLEYRGIFCVDDNIRANIDIGYLEEDEWFDGGVVLYV